MFLVETQTMQQASKLNISFYILCNTFTIFGECVFPEFPASYPDKICQIATRFKSLQKTNNRLILYGPAGNGKSTLALLLAEKFMGYKPEDQEIIIECPTITTEMSGSATKAFNDKFEYVEKNYLNQGKRFLLILEEIDSICMPIKDIQQHQSVKTDAQQTFWRFMDKHKDNPNLYVICTTNNFEKLDPGLLTRFIIRVNIQMPDEKNRISIIKHFINTYKPNMVYSKSHVPITDDNIKEFAKNTENIGIRELVGILDEAINAKKSSDNETITDFSYSDLVEALGEFNKKSTELTFWQKVKTGSLAATKYLGNNVVLVITTSVASAIITDKIKNRQQA